MYQSHPTSSYTSLLMRQPTKSGNASCHIASIIKTLNIPSHQSFNNNFYLYARLGTNWPIHQANEL